jgi:hypothetical protein
MLAVIGVLALGAASAAQGQQPTNVPQKDSSAARPDTSGYTGYQNSRDTTQSGQRTGQTDTSGFKYNGPPTDTSLKAKPGAQTGPSAGKAARKTRAAGTADTVVCKDGSNSPKSKGCTRHGGIDWASTKAAMKARGKMTTPRADTSAARSDTSTARSDTSGARSDTSSTRADTALKAKPGTQTGPDTSAAGKTDTSQHQGP